MRKVSIVLILAALWMTGCTGRPAEQATPPSPAPPVAVPDPATPQPNPVPGVALPVEKNQVSPFKRVVLDAGATAQEPGLFFLSAGTGKAEGFIYKGDVNDLSYAVSQDNRWILAQTRKFSYLVDRNTHETWLWDRNKIELAPQNQGARLNNLIAGGGRLLFERPDPKSLQGFTNEFIITDEQMKPISTFSFPPSNGWSLLAGLFSPDGKVLAIVPHGTGKLYLVDVATGAPREVVPAHGVAFVSPTPDGAGFYLAERIAHGEPLFVITKFDWNGAKSLKYEHPGHSEKISPDGRYVAFTEYAPRVTVVAELATGKEVTRFETDVLCLEDDGVEGARWLGDSSGLLVRLPKEGLKIFTVPGGELKALPFELAEPHDEPIPSPGVPLRWAVNRTELVDAAAGERFGITFKGHPFHLAPWGLSNDEIRFSTVSGGGHDSRCSPP